MFSVLVWADEFHERTGEWPKQKHWPEVIPDSDGETWGSIIPVVANGLRGLPFDPATRIRVPHYVSPANGYKCTDPGSMFFSAPPPGITQRCPIACWSSCP